jgi:hypothetical protein
MNISPELIQAFETIVGPVDVEQGLSLIQSYKWAQHMNRGATEEFREMLPSIMKNADGSAVDVDAFLYGDVNLSHPLFTLGEADTEAALRFGGAIAARTATAMKVIIAPESTPDFIKFSKFARLESITPEACPDHAFPVSNLWYEVVFPENRMPLVIPLRDNVEQRELRIANVAIHVVHSGAMDPFEKPVSEQPFKDGQVMAYVLTSEGDLLTYAGTVSFLDADSTRVFPVATIQDAWIAFGGGYPESYLHPMPLRMSGVSTFVLHTLANLMAYHTAIGSYDNVWNKPSSELEIATDTSDATVTQPKQE